MKIDNSLYAKIENQDELFASIDKVVEDIVNSKCKDLDKLIKTIRDILDNDLLEISDEVLDDMALNIPLYLYNISDELECVGIKDDLAELIKQEAYAKAHAETDGAVEARRIAAQNQIKEESVISIIYSRAYRKIKAKYDVSLELLAAVKKVISRRQDAYKLSGVQ